MVAFLERARLGEPGGAHTGGAALRERHVRLGLEDDVVVLRRVAQPLRDGRRGRLRRPRGYNMSTPSFWWQWVVCVDGS